MESLSSFPPSWDLPVRGDSPAWKRRTLSTLAVQFFAIHSLFRLYSCVYEHFIGNLSARWQSTQGSALTSKLREDHLQSMLRRGPHKLLNPSMLSPSRLPRFSGAPPHRSQSRWMSVTLIKAPTLWAPRVPTMRLLPIRALVVNHSDAIA